jgi:hypothetical protein
MNSPTTTPTRKPETTTCPRCRCATVNSTLRPALQWPALIVERERLAFTEHTCATCKLRWCDPVERVSEQRFAAVRAEVRAEAKRQEPPRHRIRYTY